MSKITNFPISSDEDTAIDVSTVRTNAFYDTARTVSDYIKDLPLSNEQNSHLVKVILDHTTAAEFSGFISGLTFCGMAANAPRGIKS